MLKPVTRFHILLRNKYTRYFEVYLFFFLRVRLNKNIYEMAKQQEPEEYEVQYINNHRIVRTGKNVSFHLRLSVLEKIVA